MDREQPFKHDIRSSLTPPILTIISSLRVCQWSLPDDQTASQEQNLARCRVHGSVAAILTTVSMHPLQHQVVVRETHILHNRKRTNPAFDQVAFLIQRELLEKNPGNFLLRYSLPLGLDVERLKIYVTIHAESQVSSVSHARLIARGSYSWLSTPGRVFLQG